MKQYLRNVGKKIRSRVKLGPKSNINLKKQIKYCLNTIFINNNIIKTASLYYPINNEIEPFEFVKYLEYRDIDISMPVVDNKKKSMLFKKWSPKDELKNGPLGNLEPLPDKKVIIPQIMVVPLLMFDRKLNRLGYGGGYYDKSIMKIKKHFKKQKKVFITIGLAYSNQEIKNMPYEKHDMTLDYIITEKEVISKLSLD